MLAIDTNVIVRYLTGDEPSQSFKARALIDGQSVFVATTVLLESEWVLRRAYGFSNQALAKAFSAFAGLPTVTLEDESLAADAIGWLSRGVDFAGALNLASASARRECEVFATFDTRLAKAARIVSAMEIRAL